MASPTDVPLTGMVPVPPDVRVNMGEAKPMLPTPPAPVRSCCCWGRVFHHWTQYCVAAGDVIAVVGGAYALVKGDYFEAGCFGLGLVVLTVAFVAIGCLTPLKDLENELEFYKTKLLESKQQEQRLNIDIQQLEEVKNAMAQEVIAAKSTMEELGKLLNQDTMDFQKFANNIGDYQKQANGLLDTYKKFRLTFVEVERQLNESKRLNKIFQRQLNQLKGAVNTIEGNETDLAQEVEKFGTNVRELEKGKQDREAQLQELQEFGVNFRAQVTSMADQVGSLVDKVSKIDTTAWKAVTLSVTDLKAVVKETRRSHQRESRG